jgi:hypothetical protein
LRKFWKDQKHTDKFIKTTFRRREKDRMKTRRNKKNEQEGLIKLKEIRDSTKKYVVELIKCSQEREIMKKNYAESLQLEFELEAMNFIKGEKDKDKDKNIVENKIKEFLLKVQINKYKPSESKKRLQIHEENNTINLETSIKASSGNNVVVVPGSTGFNVGNNRINKVASSLNVNLANETSTKDLNNNKATFLGQNKITKNLQNAYNEKLNSNLINGVTAVNGVRTTHIKRQKNKPVVNIDDNLPKISDILNLVEEEKPEEQISLMHRIRLNRKGKLVIDRYIKSSNSTNPFDNSFDNNYNIMRKYEEDLSKINLI